MKRTEVHNGQRRAQNSGVTFKPLWSRKIDSQDTLLDFPLRPTSNESNPKGLFMVGRQTMTSDVSKDDIHQG